MYKFELCERCYNTDGKVRTTALVCACCYADEMMVRFYPDECLDMMGVWDPRWKKFYDLAQELYASYLLACVNEVLDEFK